MELKQINKGNVTVIQLEGKLMGGPDATQLHESLHKLINADIKNVVIDLKGVTVRNSGGNLCLAHPSDKIKNILNITKLSSVFTSYDKIDEAIASFL